MTQKDNILKMEFLCQIIGACFAIVLLIQTWNLLKWAYIRPKSLEKILRKQGLKGNSYRLLYGDLMEMAQAHREALSKPITFEDDIKPRVIPCILKVIEKHGNDSFYWQGPSLSVMITDAALIKEVMHKYNEFVKPMKPNPLVRLFAPGLVTLEKEKWAKHRKIINPAFHLEKLKLMIPAFYLSCDEVLEELERRLGRKVFYFAGQETTLTLLSWTLILLSKYSDWQTKAREEVIGVFGNQNPNSHGINQLKIVSMILYEILRLYPPANILVRQACGDIKLGNFTIPAGVELSMPVILLHHDREVWGDDAMEFNPQRFSEGVAKAQKGQGAFFPFGWGPRICIGQNFSLLEAKVVLSMILQRYSFELSPSYTHAPQTALTMQPQYGVHLVVRRR